MRALKFIAEIFKKFPFLLLTSTALLLFVGLFNACSLLSISPVVDFLINSDSKDMSPLTQKIVNVLESMGLPVNIISLLIIFIVFIALSSVFQVFARHSILKTKYAVLRDIMVGAFNDFFSARWHFFSSNKQGVLLNTFNREITIVGDAFGAMSLFFSNILQTSFYLVVPFYLSWQVTFISLGIACLFAVPFLLLGRLSYRLGALNTATSNHISSVIQENLSLAKVVLGFGNQHKSVDNLSGAFDAHRKVTVKSQIINTAIPILYRPFGVIMIVIALVIARNFGVLLSETMVLVLALRQAAASIGEVVRQKNSLENFFPSYEQIQTLRKRAKELHQKSGGKQFQGFTQKLCVEKLSFAYPGGKSVLIDVNVNIPKGKMAAFVGQSGAGKSTFIDMIMGFHQPTSGRIMFDDIALQDFNINSYRKKIGYVPQDSILFNSSIRDNLLWTHESATEDEIIQAAVQANAAEFINRLPEGYNTIVGDRGVRLSGGQVQRVALARAILRKPELLILDEATSSLDTYSERLIQQAIENIAKETTVIIVAHRLSTVVNADYIYVFDEGRIVEEGTYLELVRINGHFNNMVKLQALEAVQ